MQLIISQAVPGIDLLTDVATLTWNTSGDILFVVGALIFGASLLVRGYGCLLRIGFTFAEDDVDWYVVFVIVFFPPLSILLGLVTSALSVVAFVGDVFASCAAYAVLGRYVRPIHDTLCSLCWFTNNLCFHL